MMNIKHNSYFTESGFDTSRLVELSAKSHGKDIITEYRDLDNNKIYYLCDSGNPFLSHYGEEQMPDSFTIYAPYLMKMADMDENTVYSNPDTMDSEDGACIEFNKKGEFIDLHCQCFIEVWYGVHDFSNNFEEVAENITYHTGNLTMKEIKDKFISAGLTFNGYMEHYNNDD